MDFFHLIFSIFDDGSFHTEPFPHLIRHFSHVIRNIKGNEFVRLFDVWFSSVHWAAVRLLSLQSSQSPPPLTSDRGCDSSIVRFNSELIVGT